MIEITRQQARDLLKLAGEKFLTLDNGVKVKFVGTDKDFNNGRRTKNCRLYVCNLNDFLGSTDLEILDIFVKRKLSRVFDLIGVNRDVNIKSLGDLKLIFYVGFNRRYNIIESHVLTLFKDENGKFITPFSSDCENGSYIYIESLQEIAAPFNYWDYSLEVDEIDLRDKDTYSRYVSGNERVFGHFSFLQERLVNLLEEAFQKNLRSLTGYINASINNTTEEDPLRYVEPNKYLSYLLSDNDAETLSILRRYRLCNSGNSEQAATTNFSEDF